MRFKWTLGFWVILLNPILDCTARHTIFRTRRSPDEYPDIIQRLRYPYSLPEQWFIQRLDHFRPNNHTWYQRYFSRDVYYKEGGPVFLEMTGEWTSDPRSLTGGFMVELAKQHGAFMFQLEHRYYGKSRPASNVNLKYLSSHQALADAAHFIRAMNKNYNLPNETKWIAFGGSYAGNLVTWLRDKYPDVLHGAVASSAPLQARLDFPEFLNEVGASLASHSEECAKTVKKTFREINRLLKTTTGQETLVKTLGLCGPLNVTNELDMADLIFTLADELPLIAEGGRGEISEFCYALGNSSSKGLLKRYAAAVGFQIDSTGATCTATEFDRDVKEIKRDALNNFDFDSAELQWLYQMCTEFGYFTTSKTPQSLLGASIPVHFFSQQCIEIFGDHFNLEFVQERVDRTNKIYRGLEVNATRVIFVHGSLDPWRVLGLTETRNPESPVVLVEGESHCTVDWSPQDTDSPALVAARQLISDILEEWLRPDPTSALESEPSPQESPTY